MNLLRFPLLLCLGLCLANSFASAQSVPSPRSTNTPTAEAYVGAAAGVPASGLYAPATWKPRDGILVTPSLGLSLGFSDNVTLAPAATARRSGSVTLAPKFTAASAYRAGRYALVYQGELIQYTSSANDNTNNHELAATAEQVLDTRVAVTGRAAYQNRFDPTGTTDRARTSSGPDHWRGLSGSGLLRYGAPGAKGRLELEMGVLDKKYLNNRAITQDADVLSTNLAARFGVRVAPKTMALLEYRYAGFDYGRDVQNLDGTEQRYLVGAEWEATAQTSGSFKIGYLDKRYKQGRANFGGLTWEGGLTWRPLTYTTVELSTGSSASDPTGVSGNFVKNRFISASWAHQWASYLNSRVAYTHITGDYAGTARRDMTDTLGVTTNYDFRRWARLGASYEFSRRNSSLDLFDYDRNLFSLFGEFSF